MSVVFRLAPAGFLALAAIAWAAPADDFLLTRRKLVLIGSGLAAAACLALLPLLRALGASLATGRGAAVGA